MSDSVKPENVVEPAKLDSFETLSAAVKLAVKAGQGGIKDEVVKDLAKDELTQRKSLIVEGLRKYKDLKKELEKANKPDVKNYTTDGALLASFSEAKHKEFQKAKKNFETLDAALNKALKDEPDYEPLKRALGKGGNDKPETEGENKENKE